VREAVCALRKLIFTLRKPVFALRESSCARRKLIFTLRKSVFAARNSIFALREAVCAVHQPSFTLHEPFFIHRKAIAQLRLASSGFLAQSLAIITQPAEADLRRTLKRPIENSLASIPAVNGWPRRAKRILRHICPSGKLDESGYTALPLCRLTLTMRRADNTSSEGQVPAS
jgi:hypothetical protein